MNRWLRFWWWMVNFGGSDNRPAACWYCGTIVEPGQGVRDQGVYCTTNHRDAHSGESL